MSNREQSATRKKNAKAKRSRLQGARSVKRKTRQIKTYWLTARTRILYEKPSWPSRDNTKDQAVDLQVDALKQAKNRKEFFGERC